MIVKVIPARGSSFKGLANYLLHDPGARTSERVAWTATHNLATDDPELAWRLQAATAMDQDRLKEQAGVRKSGRKSQGKPVLHIVINWKDVEAQDRQLDKEQMIAAAKETLKQIGRGETGARPAQYADQHQALIVAHEDKAHPHVHIALNMVHPEHGRLLNAAYDKRALSRWAQRYEEERGKIYCEQRVLNNAARDRGEFTRGTRDKARHIYERAAGNDNSARAGMLQAEHRAKAKELSEKGRDLLKAHEQRMDQLEQSHKAQLEALRVRTQRLRTLAVDEVRKVHRPSWEESYRLDAEERALFDQREEKLWGRIHNAVQAIDFRAIVRGEDRRQAISEAFSSISSSGARLEALKRTQEARTADLLARQRAEEERVSLAEQQRYQQDLQAQRAKFLEERADALIRREQDSSDLQGEWRAHGRQQREAWAQLGREQTRRRELERWHAERRASQRGQAPEKKPPSPAPSRDQEGREAERRRRRQEFLSRRDRERGDFER